MARSYNNSDNTQQHLFKNKILHPNYQVIMTNLRCMAGVYQVEGVNFLGVKDSVMGSYPPYKKG
mgnify:FL=1